MARVVFQGGRFRVNLWGLYRRVGERVLRLHDVVCWEAVASAESAVARKVAARAGLGGQDG